MSGTDDETHYLELNQILGSPALNLPRNGKPPCLPCGAYAESR